MANAVPRAMTLACLLSTCAATAAIACGPQPRYEPGGGEPACEEATRRCTNDRLEQCRDGAFVVEQACDAACDPDLGCVACAPGTGTCDGATSRACLADGSAFAEVFCDPVQGMSCDDASGLCRGACAPHELGKSYVGCDFYPTVTANPVDNNFHFAVAIANSTGTFADVTIEGGALAAPQTFAVAPFGVEVRPLPWVASLKACTSTGQPLGCGYLTEHAALAAGGAYRVRSTRPVSVYQFNPLEFQIGDQRSYTNDASLLAPVTAMTGNYIVVSWPAWDTQGAWPGLSPGFVSITATVDHTAVTLTTTAPTPAANNAPAFVAGVPQTVTLDRGDVLQVTADAGDLTGSRVSADHPVQVIAGHYCTEVPAGTSACDHLEESMFPTETLADDYLITAPAVPALPDGKPRVVRIVATEPATTLTFDPPRDTPAFIVDAGGVSELAATADSFRVSADKRIVVAQYMQGFNAGGLAGDPAMTLAVATKQFRTTYVFHVPATYPTSYVDVIAPMTAGVKLDGIALVGLMAIGDTGYGVLRTSIASGNHIAEATAPVGISAYGYGPTTSYWYPAGLDLDPITLE